MGATYDVRRRCLGGLIATTVLMGCGGSPSEPDTTVASVSVTSAATLVSLGETATVSATASNAGGSALTGTTFAWSVGDGSVASVDQAGTVTALGNGSTSVTATASGIAGSTTLVVDQAPAEIEIVSGDVQFGEVALPLDSALVVRVLDALSNPIEGADVAFTATEDGSVDAASATTDALGMASTAWTLGPIAGLQEVQAETLPAGSATFTGTAAAGAPTSLSIAGGDDQTELATYALPAPIAVLVSDSFGNGVADITVHFSVGGGTLADDSVSTDLDGVASTIWTLGASVGAYASSASVDSIAGTADFTASAVGFDLAAPAGSSIVAGDTIQLSGSGFDPVLLQNEVQVDGTSAEILAGTQSSLTIVVPSYGCVPEKPVSVRLERLSVGEVDTEATVWHPAGVLSLAVGEQRMLDSPEDFCLQFLANATGGDEYLVGVTATQELDGETSFAMLANDGVTEPVLPTPARIAIADEQSPVDRSPEDILRSWERENLSRSSGLANSTVPSAAPPVTGGPLTLRVPDIGGDICGDYAAITATVRAVGTNVALATDDLNPAPEALDSSDIAALLSLLDGTIFGVASNYLSAPSDLDDNERVLVVVTQEVNRVDAGIAYSTAADLLARAGCGASDGGEIIYVSTPDPGATVGTALTKVDLLAELPPELAHELTHVIQSRRLTSSAPLLPSWLAEGQAQVVQEATGFEILGDAPGADHGAAVVAASAESMRWYEPQFEALSHFYGWDGASGRHLDAPGRCSIYGFPSTSTACTGTYAKGAAWSLVRYMTDRFGSADPGALHTSLIDADGVLDAVSSLEDVLGVDFDRLLVDWASTLHVDGQVSTADAPDLQISSWDLADVFGALPAERTLVPNEEAFSTFSLAGGLVGGGTAYTLLAQSGARGPMAIRVRTPGDEPLGTLFEPRLWVVRVR